MSKFNCTVTVERVRELLSYDFETGIFTWQVRTCNRVKVGDTAGSTNWCGYFIIRVDGVKYRAHRLAWLHYYGTWPIYVIDHKDRNPGNNKILNLQDVSRSLNQQNRGAQQGGTSFFKGVSWEQRRQRWQAQIKQNGKQTHLGYFTDEQEAAAAYEAAAKIYFTNSNPANLQDV